MTAGAGTTSVTSGDIYNSSICPKGWKLPPNTGNGSYTTLMHSTVKQADGVTPMTAINSGGQSGAEWQVYTNQFQAAPLSFILSGNYSSGSGPNYQGSGGYYWSRTAYSADSARVFVFFSDNYFNLQNSYGKYNGFPARCVMAIDYMQDFNATACTNLQTAQSLTLVDKRDLSDYKVTKLGDGNCWMTQNLRFTGASLDTSTSNVISNKTLTYYDLVANGTSGGECDSANGYNNACIKNSGNTTTGVWYNYAAASAMTIAGNSNSTVTTEDICPKNWRLSTYAEQLGIISYTDAFAPTAGGVYLDGALVSTEYGDWWSATTHNNYNTNRFRLTYRSSSHYLYVGDDSRHAGLYIRCILAS